MNIQITTRHFHGSPELHKSIHDEMERIGKFNDTITDVHVILDAEKKGQRRVEIIFNISDKRICSVAEEGNMHKAVEAAVLKAERQLKKENAKLKNHKSQSIAELTQN